VKPTVILTSHTNPYLSGVAKFNQILAGKYDIPCEPLHSYEAVRKGKALLSVKLLSDRCLNEQEAEKLVRYFLNKKIKFDIFFHSFSGLRAEVILLSACRKVFCGNREILHSLEGYRKKMVECWCPGLIDFSSVLRESRFNIFSFGMAHKIQTDYYYKLWQLMEKSKIDYSLWISTAFHEKAHFGDFSLVSKQLMGIFKKRLQFLGFLSDEAVSYFVKKSQLFIAFFEKGVRSNNTSVLAALRKGCPVLTNTDEYSPVWMKHGDNMLDIHQVRFTDLQKEKLEGIALRAQGDCKRYADWNALVRLIGD
jgi:hypothetical protein